MKKLLLVLSVFGMLMTSTTTSAQSKREELKQAKQAREEAKQAKNESKQAKNDTYVLKQARQEQANVTAIETLNFSFTPTTVTPAFGEQRDITSLSSYVNVDKDNFIAELPYMGYFYVQPVEASQVPFKIYSNQFLYSVRTVDGIIFKVTIVPSDAVGILNENIKFNFTFNKNTRAATLVVTTDNRNSITFTGSFQ